MIRFTAKEQEAMYQKRTAVIVAYAKFVTEFVAGQPADEKGVRAFVQYHLELTGPEAEEAVKRILHEEVGVRNVDGQPTDELEKQEVYAVNSLRRDEEGRPWIGNWMIQASFKQGASRLGLFVEGRGEGVKGGMSEAGRVHAEGISLLDPLHPERVYIFNEDLSGPPKTYWSIFMGNVRTGKGEKSIYQHSECVAPGSRFVFNFRCLTPSLTEYDLAEAAAMAGTMGLGSCRSLQRGRYVMDPIEVSIGERRPKPDKTKKAAKVDGAEVKPAEVGVSEAVQQ